VRCQSPRCAQLVPHGWRGQTPFQQRGTDRGVEVEDKANSRGALHRGGKAVTGQVKDKVERAGGAAAHIRSLEDLLQKVRKPLHNPLHEVVLVTIHLGRSYTGSHLLLWEAGALTKP
jgi:hypothetical protein